MTQPLEDYIARLPAEQRKQILATLKKIRQTQGLLEQPIHIFPVSQQTDNETPVDAPEAETVVDAPKKSPLQVATASISGRALDADGRPITDGAEITVYRIYTDEEIAKGKTDEPLKALDGTILSTIVDSAGTFVIDKVPIRRAIRVVGYSPVYGYGIGTLSGKKNHDETFTIEEPEMPVQVTMRFMGTAKLQAHILQPTEGAVEEGEVPVQVHITGTDACSWRLYLRNAEETQLIYEGGEKTPRDKIIPISLIATTTEQQLTLIVEATNVQTGEQVVTERVITLAADTKLLALEAFSRKWSEQMEQKGFAQHGSFEEFLLALQHEFLPKHFTTGPIYKRVKPSTEQLENAWQSLMQKRDVLYATWLLLPVARRRIARLFVIRWAVESPEAFTIPEEGAVDRLLRHYWSDNDARHPPETTRAYREQSRDQYRIGDDFLRVVYHMLRKEKDIPLTTEQQAVLRDLNYFYIPLETSNLTQGDLSVILGMVKDSLVQQLGGGKNDAQQSANPTTP
jgi:hypothetical protein